VVEILSTDPQNTQIAMHVEGLQPVNEGSGSTNSPSSLRGVSPPIDSSIGVPDLSNLVERAIHEIKAVGEKISGLEAFVESYRSGDLPSLRQGMEELRKDLKSIEEGLALVKRDASIVRLIGIVGLWKQPMCVNNRDGICIAWRLNSDGEFRNIYGDQSIVDVDGVKRVRVSIAYHLCGICPLFRPRNA
jgi:hypothetical protein